MEEGEEVLKIPLMDVIYERPMTGNKIILYELKCFDLIALKEIISH